MASINRLSPDAIRTLAKNIEACAGEIDAAAKSINSAVSSTIPGNWSGTAASVFAEEWEKDNTAYAQKFEAFAQLVTMLLSIADKAEATEQLNTATAAYHG